MLNKILHTDHINESHPRDTTGWISRFEYKKHYFSVEISTRQLKASVRAGDSEHVGGYNVLFLCSDGGVLCHECVKKELYQIIYSIRNKINDGWRVVCVDMDYGDYDDIVCDHCGKEFPNCSDES